MGINIDITREAHDLLWGYIDAVHTEIGGVGYARKDEDGSILWDRTLLVPQEVTSGTVDFTDPFYLVEQAHRDGVLSDPNFVWVWWHSHANMGVFWSTTDEQEFIEPFKRAGAKALISIVGNLSHNYKMRVDLFDHALIEHITLENARLNVLRPEGLTAQAKAGVKEFVTERKPEFTGSWWQSKNGNQNDSRQSSFDAQAWDLDDTDVETIAFGLGMDFPLSDEQRKEIREAFGVNAPEDSEFEGPWVSFGDEDGNVERVPLQLAPGEATVEAAR